MRRWKEKECERKRVKEGEGESVEGGKERRAFRGG